MTKYVVINQACDGRHVSIHSSLGTARKKARDLVGDAHITLEVGCSYYSDWGNRVLIEERPDGWTASLERRASEAFDARECGTATKKQLELLDSLYW